MCIDLDQVRTFDLSFGIFALEKNISLYFNLKFKAEYSKCVQQRQI